MNNDKFVIVKIIKQPHENMWYYNKIGYQFKGILTTHHNDSIINIVISKNPEDGWVYFNDCELISEISKKEYYNFTEVFINNFNKFLNFILNKIKGIINGSSKS